jgi:hypothetical protein
MDVEILILLILLSTHLVSFWIGWTLRDVERRGTSAR